MSDNMDNDTVFFLKLIALMIGIIAAIILIVAVPTADYSDMNSLVKVQEAGTRYAFMWFGEQNYIRVQNVYSEQYSSSSESWETCIKPGDLQFFEGAKNNKSIVNIHVKGNGLSTIFTCISGDLVIDYSLKT